jgi:uncharacterized protein (TIGR02246 family)
MKKYLLVLLALGMVLGCAKPSVELTDADRDAVKKAMSDYVAAWLANDSSRVMNLMESDSVLVPAEKEPVVGATTIRNYWWPAGSPPYSITKYDTTVDQLNGSGDTAVVRGKQTIEWTMAGTKWRTRGNYVTTLHRTAQGWRIALQMAGNGPTEQVQ